MSIHKKLLIPLFCTVKIFAVQVITADLNDIIHCQIPDIYQVIKFQNSDKNSLEYVPSRFKNSFFFKTKKVGEYTITFHVRQKITRKQSQHIYKIIVEDLSAKINDSIEMISCSLFLQNMAQQIQRPLSRQQKNMLRHELESFGRAISKEKLKRYNLYDVYQHLESLLRVEENQSDAYTILGVRPTDSLKSITRAYRALAAKWHPDKFAGKTKEEQQKAQEMMIKINNAYEEVCKLKEH